MTLTLTSPDGDQGYPGTLTASVTYTLDRRRPAPRLHGRDRRPTVLNLTNHSYFNLAGGGDVLGHVVRMDAEHYLPVDDDKIPTGELGPGQGHPVRLHRPARGGRQARRRLRPLLRPGRRHHRGDPVSGRTMEVTTTEPGVQFYAGGMLDADATPYGPFAGLCLETQHFPDAPNQPHFPSTVLRPGERVHLHHHLRLHGLISRAGMALSTSTATSSVDGRAAKESTAAAPVRRRRRRSGPRIRTAGVPDRRRHRETVCRRGAR